MAAIRKVIDVQGDSVMEHAVAELMQEGAIRKHARKAYSVYKDRRENMEKLLSHYLFEKASFVKPKGGLAYWVQLKQRIDTKHLAIQLLSKGVSVIPTEPFSFEMHKLSALRLGYASLTDTELENGLSIIGKLL
jgi:GntR family transcriptional regulator/MocR family aminotransferase